MASKGTISDLIDKGVRRELWYLRNEGKSKFYYVPPTSEDIDSLAKEAQDIGKLTTTA